MSEESCEHVLGFKFDMDDWREIGFLVTDEEERPLNDKDDERFRFCPRCGEKR